MRFLQTDKGFFTVKRVNGEDRYTKCTQQEWLDLKEKEAMNQRIMKATITGGGIALGSAGGELALGGVAAVAEAAVAAPAIVTVAAIAGGAALLWAGCSAISDWANE